MKKLTTHKILLCWLLLATLAWPGLAWAQEPVATETPDPDVQPEAPEQVEVEPVAEDEQIDERLTRILQATDWFIGPSVTVQEGVVFLDGRTRQEEYRAWAGNLARNTQDVVAVVNRIEIIPRSAWDFSPALTELMAIGRAIIQALPLIVFGIIALFLSGWLTKWVAQFSHRLLSKRLESPLLATIASRTIAVPVFLLGLYLVLQVTGLTRLALTLLGGTGIMGIVVGFAFRDIAENFLASLLLSMRRPFRPQDMIEVDGHMGIVQQMNTRSTVLMTQDGNHIQIPNATVFKSTITNFTANPNRRVEFVVGIGYDDSISQAQAIIAQVLDTHPAVLKNPEPLVLVDNLGAATVNLRVYFWFDAIQYSPIKVKSSLARLTKQAIDEAGISMPDEAREVIFPQGIPIFQGEQAQAQKALLEAKEREPDLADEVLPEPVTNEAEGDLRSEDQEIQQQAKQSRTPEGGENLIN